MYGMLWLLVGAMTGCLTGIVLGEKGYGKVLSTGCVRSLDILFGVAGASLGYYLLFWAAIDRGSIFSNDGTAVLGASAIVGICRQVSEGFFRSTSYRGRSRVAFIEWHDNVTVKELARWKARRAEPDKSKSPTA